MRAILMHVITDDQVRSSIHHRIQRSLDANFENARHELDKIVSDEQAQPITYNHYYTDNIQKAREDTAREKLQDSMDRAIKDDWSGKFHVSNTSLDLQRACVESLAALDAYYKVAMKTFVDNVCRQVIERHLLASLMKVFDPVRISQLSDEDVAKIASETVQVRRRRVELQGLRQALEESLGELQD